MPAVLYKPNGRMTTLIAERVREGGGSEDETVPAAVGWSIDNSFRVPGKEVGGGPPSISLSSSQIVS